jgi:hypothetical protein
MILSRSWVVRRRVTAGREDAIDGGVKSVNAGCCRERERKVMRVVMDGFKKELFLGGVFVD